MVGCLVIGLSASAAHADVRMPDMNVGVMSADSFGSKPSSGWRDGETHGDWRTVYHGYGDVGISRDGVLYEVPRASKRRNETHACLVASTGHFSDFVTDVRMRTVRQVRKGRANPWEVAWILWHYTDDVHFYYLSLKPNGWELGKEDPAYPGAQRYLLTSSLQRFPIGRWYDVRIAHVGNTFAAWVDGKQLFEYQDLERPYGGGAIGLYNEDSLVNFDDVTIAGAPAR
jgi:hypothetical protein